MDFPQTGRKKLLIMLLVVVVGVALVGGTIWKLFLSGAKGSREIHVKAEKVNVNFDLLESDEIKALEPFNKVSSTTATIGRSNPFRATSTVATTSPSE